MRAHTTLVCTFIAGIALSSAVVVVGGQPTTRRATNSATTPTVTNSTNPHPYPDSRRFEPDCARCADAGRYVKIISATSSSAVNKTAGDVLLWKCDANTQRAQPVSCNDTDNDYDHITSYFCELQRDNDHDHDDDDNDGDDTDPFECPAAGLRQIAIRGSCTDFHLCVDGRRRRRRCADTMHFDAARGGCNFPELAECRRDWCPPRNGPEMVTVPSTGDCGEFYVCYDNEPLPFRCLGALHWNQQLQDCDLPANVACEIVSTTTTTTTTTTAGPPPQTPVCPTAPGIHQLPHASDCTLFYVCTGDGLAHPRRCPDALEFDPSLGQCNRPENFECAHRR